MIPRSPLLLCFFVSASVLTASDTIVTATIIDSGYTERHEPTFVVQAEVKNLSNAPVSYAIMCCSWNSSWRSEPTKYMFARDWACDANFPVELRLEAGESVMFRFQVCATGTSLPREIKKIRLGFVAAFRSSEYYFSPSSDPEAKVLWSDYLELPRINDRVLPEFHEVKPTKALLR